MTRGFLPPSPAAAAAGELIMAFGAFITGPWIFKEKRRKDKPKPEVIVTLQSCHHRTYVTAERDGTCNANRVEAKRWERFATSNYHDGSVYFRSHHGTFLHADPASEKLRFRKGDGMTSGFKVIKHPDGKVSLRTCIDHYVTVDNKSRIYAKVRHIGEREKFWMKTVSKL